MKSSMRLFPMLILAGVGLLVVAFSFASESKPDSAALYKQKCSMCHGVDGKGFSAIKTPDFTDPKWQASAKDSEMVEVIKNGKKDTMMKGFADQLKEEEIHSLVKYIRSLNSKNLNSKKK